MCLFDDLTELQLQYYRLEHITRGANHALNDCGPGNILRELAKTVDRKELDQAKKELDHVKTENAHLQAQVTAMAQELSQKNNVIRKYHAEQVMSFQQIRDLVGQPADIATKAQLYDQLVGSGDPASTRQTIPILVKYTQKISDLFEEIQKIIPRSGTPQRVLYLGPLGSRTGTFYKAVGEVAVVNKPPAATELDQGSRPASSGRAQESARSSQAKQKSTGSERSGRGQSPVRRIPDREHTPDTSCTPVRRHTPERGSDSGKRKAHARDSSPPDCMMLEVAPTTSKATPSTSRAASRAASRQKLEHLCSCPPDPPAGPDLAQTRTSRRILVSGAEGDRTPRAEGTGDSEEETNPSPTVRRVLTRLRHVSSPGTSTLLGGLDTSYKEKATPKKPQSS